MTHDTRDRGKWREICEAMVNELDPAKMSELAAQLVAALDEQKIYSAPRAKVPKTASPSPNQTADRMSSGRDQVVGKTSR